MEDITRSFLTRPQLELYKREAMGEQDGFASIYVPEGYRQGIATGIAWGLARIWKKKKGTIPSLAQEELKKDMNSATGTQKSPNFRKESCKMHADNCKKSQKQWAGCR